MAGHRIAARNAIAKVDEVAAEVEMKIEVAIDMVAEEVEVAVVLMEVARTGLK